MWVFPFNVTTRGRVHILVGVIAILAGAGLYPVWALLVIVVDFFVIWELVLDDRDVTGD